MKLVLKLFTGFCFLSCITVAAQDIPQGYYQKFDYNKENAVLNYGYFLTYAQPFSWTKPAIFSSGISQNYLPSSFEAYYFLQFSKKLDFEKTPLGVDLSLKWDKNEYLVKSFNHSTSGNYHHISESKTVKLGIVLRHFFIRGMYSDVAYQTGFPIDETGPFAGEDIIAASTRIGLVPGGEIGLTTGNDFQRNFNKRSSGIFDVYANWSYKLPPTEDEDIPYIFNRIQFGVNYKIMLRLKKQLKLMVIMGARFQRDTYLTNDNAYNVFFNSNSEAFQFGYNVSQAIFLLGVGISF